MVGRARKARPFRLWDVPAWPASEGMVITMSKPGQYEPVALLVLRVAFGAMMLLGHGLSKLLGFGRMADSFPDPIGLGSQVSLVLAIGAEVGCALLVMLGFATRIATIPLIITMLVAMFLVHGGDPWAKRELAAVYLRAQGRASSRY